MKPRHIQAFSLVEVTLAVGIAGFCLIAIFGLLPAGLISNRTSLQQTAAANITSAMVADLLATPRTATPTSPRFGLTIPPVGGTSNMQTLFFGESNEAIPAGATPAPRMRATVYLTPPAAGKTSTSGRIQITWPALADPVPGTPPTKFSGSYEVYLALDRN